MVEAMDAYWKDHPPLHLMVGAYLGCTPSESRGQDVHEMAEHGIPVSALTSDEFAAVLAEHGLPDE